ncbi:hypothetical protein [Clostridium sp.]|uniref:hypothetical protein n=1 Tax=Clostridium sp. TaxID=1506 RepID=UPI003D6CC16B
MDDSFYKQESEQLEIRLKESEEKTNNVNELIIANKELVFQIREELYRTTELINAYKELALQSKEKEKWDAELIICNKRQGELISPTLSKQ